MVVYTEHEERADHAGRVIEDLAGRHPSRALVIIARPTGDESHIEAQLAAHSHLSPDVEQHVCCEEVRLAVSGRAAGHLHSIIIPLLVPDLPVYIWWAEQLPEDTHLLLEMLATSDHLIVDSERFEDQLDGLLRLASLGEAQPNATIGDLAWGRLTPWREVLQHQRGIEEVRHHLASVESLEIRYADSHGQKRLGQGLLFLSWIALELGWATTAASAHGREHVSLSHGNRALDAYLVPVDYPAIEAGGLISVKISCRSENGSALITVSRTGDPYHLTIRTEHRGQAAEEHVRIEPAEPSDLLVMELSAPTRDPEFRRVLKGASPFIQALLA
jgi:glucose-6-phosphate dehydrogenase assembly protein OpcA